MNYLLEIEELTEILCKNGIVFSEYIEAMSSTFNYNFYMPMVARMQSTNWSEPTLEMQEMVYFIKYSAILERLIEDDIPEMFVNLFPEYCNVLAIKDDNRVVRDNQFNSIFHYDAVHGPSRIDAYSRIEKRINEVLSENTFGMEFNYSILDDKNSNGISVSQVISKNKKKNML